MVSLATGGGAYLTDTEVTVTAIEPGTGVLCEWWRLCHHAARYSVGTADSITGEACPVHLVRAVNSALGIGGG